jgi:TetR/AcrR family transcriptional repressor of nem operon
MIKTIAKNVPQARSTATRSAAATVILDTAELLAQTRGFNGFSYADIAARLGVTKASLHYHFRSKADLGRALIERYHVVFMAALADIDRDVDDSGEKLRRYVALYDAVIRNDRMCLCGMLAAEQATLPPAMQVLLQRFFDANERWLATVIEAGGRASRMIARGSAKERARVFMGSLEGAMLVAQSYKDPLRFRSAADYLLADICIPMARAAAKPVNRRPAIKRVRAA